MAEILILDPKLDLSAVPRLHTAIGSMLKADLTVDASEVTHLGALCMQTLMAASRAVRATGHRFELVNASDRVCDQLAAMGVTPKQIEEGLA